MDWKSKLRELQAPFNWSDIKWRVGKVTKDKKKGMAMAYVTSRAIQNRLDEVFGVNGWRNEYKPWRNTSQLCGISVYDPDIKEWITKWDGADDTNFEATKGGLSASMKRAAIQWGIGRYLYDLPSKWVELDEYGGIAKGVKLELPQWAYAVDCIQPVMVKTLVDKIKLKGLTEDKISAKYFKTKVEDLSVEEYKKVMKSLDKYEDVKEGEEPVLKGKN